MKWIPKHQQNYWTIGALSAILMFVVPFCGSVAGLGLNLPNTVAGWLVWTTVKILACVLNVMIFDRFVKQAKVNVKNESKFIEACEILNALEPETKPLSPKEYFSKLYRHKGGTLLVTTLLSVICVTQAILTFDYVTFIGHILAVIIAVVFGLNTMTDTEDYYLGDFWRYAKMVQKDLINAETVVHERDASVTTDRGVDLLVTSDSTECTSNL